MIALRWDVSATGRPRIEVFQIIERPSGKRFRIAIADTHPKDGDVEQAPLGSGGGSEGNRT